MVEASMFDSEFVAMNIYKEIILDFPYKLHMFGLMIDRQEKVFCDNRGLIRNKTFL